MMNSITCIILLVLLMTSRVKSANRTRNGFNDIWLDEDHEEDEDDIWADYDSSPEVQLAAFALELQHAKEDCSMLVKLLDKPVEADKSYAKLINELQECLHYLSELKDEIKKLTDEVIGSHSAEVAPFSLNYLDLY